MHNRASSVALIVCGLALALSAHAQDAPQSRRAPVSAACIGTQDPFIDGACDLSDEDRGAMRVAATRDAGQLSKLFGEYTQQHAWTIGRFIVFDFVLSVELRTRGLPGPADADLAAAVALLVDDTARLLPGANDIELRTVKANLEGLLLRDLDRLDARTFVAAFKVPSSTSTRRAQ